MRPYYSYLLVFLLSLFFLPTYAQQNMHHFVWARTVEPTDTNHIMGFDIAADKRGHIYTVSSFERKINIGGVPHNAVGLHDLILTKYDTSGKWLWSKTYGEPNRYFTGNAAITTDTSGDIIMAGRCSDSITKDQYHYLTKYNPSGTQLWFKKFRIYTSGLGTPVIATNTGGDIFMTGSLTDSIEINGQTFRLNQSNNRPKTYICKLDRNGQLLWIRLSEYNESYPNGITVDNSGNVLIAGVYGKDSMKIDGVTLHNIINPKPSCSTIMFVIKFDTNGNAIWGKDADPIYRGTTECNEGNALAVDQYNDVYITGIFRDTISFDNVMLIDTTTVASGNSAVYLLKLDGNNGKTTWIKEIDGMGQGYNQFGCDVKINPTGEVFVGLTGLGLWAEANIMQVDINGSYYWNIKYPERYFVGIHNMDVDGSGNVYLYGRYSRYHDVVLGKDTLTAYPFATNGYIAKLAKTNAELNGIKQVNDLAEQVSLYPNPNNGRFSIQSKLPLDNLYLYDVLGKQVAIQPLNPNSQTHDIIVPDLPPGIYTAHLSGKGFTLVKKLIIQ